MMICRRAEVLPVELIVRGYITGSGWKDYLRTGAVCGIPLPEGLRESDRLPQPLFTPSTKAETGHDENISFDEMVKVVGAPLAERARDLAIALYSFAAARAESVGIILADTKFEFGTLPERRPDPHRRGADPGFVALLGARRVRAGSRPGLVRQAVRARLPRDARLGQDVPGPELPAEVVAGTQQRYEEAFDRITGGSFADYLAHDTVSNK